jgi:hypothetical protein
MFTIAFLRETGHHAECRCLTHCFGALICSTAKIIRPGFMEAYKMTIPVIVLMLSVSAFTLLAATADEVRHTKFSGPLIGTWALSQDLCGSKEKSNIAISEDQFSSSDGNCKVQWIVERASARGTTYGVRARCVDPSLPEKPRAVDLIIWPQGSDSISVGTAFDNLKVYQRCPFK